MKPFVIIRLSPTKTGYTLRMEMRVTENRTTSMMIGRAEVRDIWHGMRTAEASVAGLWKDLRDCMGNGGGASAGPTKAGDATLPSKPANAGGEVRAEAARTSPPPCSQEHLP